MTDVFLCDGVRTPVGRYGGALSAVRPDDLLAHVIARLVARVPSLPVEAIDEVYAGCANQAGEDNRNVARMALLLAGLPQEIPGTTMNRLCGSGLDAIGHAARAIRAGEIEVAIAGGVESMSRAPFVQGKATEAFSRSADIFDTTIGWRFINPAMEAHTASTPWARPPKTSPRRGRSRAPTRTPSRCAARRAPPRAQKSGRLAREIVAGRDQGSQGRRDAGRARRASARDDARKTRRLSSRSSARAAPSRPAMHRASTTAPPPFSSRLAPRSTRHGLTPDRADLRPRDGGLSAAHHGHRPGAGDAQADGAARPEDRRFRRRSNSTRPSPRRRSPACAISACRTTRST